MADLVVREPVIVSLNDLENGSVTFESLDEAFGSSSLGILIVKDLPEEFDRLRASVLSSSSYLGNLPKKDLDSLENARAKHLVGWSCGKETLRSGHFDTLKGSYYVNCAFYQDPKLQNAPEDEFPDFPEYTAPNVWPSPSLLPGFKDDFEQLCNLIIDTAALVARACDRYALKNIDGYKAGYLEHVVSTSLTTKARLLHYFPQNPTSHEVAANGDSLPNGPKNEEEDDWCATHVDHGCLTGLTSAMFVDEAATPPHLDSSAGLVELPKSPDPKAGLYIRSRTNETVKTNIPRDCLAFQTGEALERITSGRFKAVPHFVRGAKAENGRKVARNTLAVFTQPNLGQEVREGQTFAQFAKEVVERNR